MSETKAKKTGGRDSKHKKKDSADFTGGWLFCVKNSNANFQDCNWGFLFKTAEE